MTPDSKDLVSKMLNKNPNNRVSALEAIKHPWFQHNGTNLQILNIEFEELDDEIPLTDE